MMYLTFIDVQRAHIYKAVDFKSYTYSFLQSQI